MIRWAYLFIDRPYARFEEAAAFWTAATATTLSPQRGVFAEFATLLPVEGDAHLKIQGVGDAGGAHIDFEVDDAKVFASTALDLGATLATSQEGLWVLRSPGGRAFCVTAWDGAGTFPEVAAGPSGAAARLDQICFDTPADRFEVEVAFWEKLTGWGSFSGSRPEFHLIRPDERPSPRLLVHRLDDPASAGAHLDVACSDIAAVRAWHESLGATLVSEYPHWTIMRDPVGGTYCLTARDPRSGVLPGS